MTIGTEYLSVDLNHLERIIKEYHQLRMAAQARTVDELRAINVCDDLINAVVIGDDICTGENMGCLGDALHVLRVQRESL